VLPATTTIKETKSYTVGSVSGKEGEYRYLKILLRGKEMMEAQEKSGAFFIASQSGVGSPIRKTHELDSGHHPGGECHSSF